MQDSNPLSLVFRPCISCFLRITPFWPPNQGWSAAKPQLIGPELGPQAESTRAGILNRLRCFFLKTCKIILDIFLSTINWLAGFLVAINSIYSGFIIISGFITPLTSSTRGSSGSHPAATRPLRMAVLAAELMVGPGGVRPWGGQLPARLLLLHQDR